MGEALLFTLLGAAGIGGTIWAILKYFKHRDQVSAVWRVAAERLGGRFDESHGDFLSTGGVSIQARVEGVSVLVDHYTTSSGNTQVTYTRIRTQAPGSGSLFLRVSREGILASVSKVLGGQDIHVGVPAFDERFIIKGSDEALVRAWLDDPSRSAIAAAERYGFTVESGELRAERVGLETSVQSLVDAVRGASAVATGGRRLLDRWTALGERLGGRVAAKQEAFEVNGGTMTIVERAGAKVLVDVLQEKLGRLGASSRLWTRLRARHPAATSDDRFAIVTDTGEAMLEDAGELVEVAPPRGDDGGYRLLATETSWGDANLTVPIWSRVLTLAPTAVTGDSEEVTVILEGLVLDERRLSAALELATELASITPTGPYR